jgi:hypothetical protein
MLLGMPFLAATNPDIDWTKGAFKGTIVVRNLLMVPSGTRRLKATAQEVSVNKD